METELSIVSQKSNELLFGIELLIQNAVQKVAISLNAETNLLYWSIGNYITSQLQYDIYSQYGGQMFATMSQTLSWGHIIERSSCVKKMYF